MQYTAYHRLGSLLSVVAPVTATSLVNSKCTLVTKFAVQWSTPGVLDSTATKGLKQTQRPAGYESIYFSSSSRSQKVVQHNLIVFKDAFT